MRTPAENRKKGVLIGSTAILIASLFIVLVAGSSGYAQRLFSGVYLLFLGLMFLAAYFYENKSFLFRWMILICERWSFPRHRNMAILYSAVLLFVGFASIISAAVGCAG